MTSSPETSRLPDRCGIVVLCGGGSARMGIDKSALLIDDATTFLQTIIKRAAALTDKIVIAVGSGQSQALKQRYANCKAFDQVTWAEDGTANQGPMEGIHQGLLALEQQFTDCDLAFVTGCDVPELNGQLIMALLDQINDHDAVTPVDGKRIYGMTAVYRTHVWKNAKQNVAQQQLRVSELAKTIDSFPIDVSQLKTHDQNLNAFENINTPDDYFAFLSKNNIECTEKMKQQFTEPT